MCLEPRAGEERAKPGHRARKKWNWGLGGTGGGGQGPWEQRTERIPLAKSPLGPQRAPVTPSAPHPPQLPAPNLLSGPHSRSLDPGHVRGLRRVAVRGAEPPHGLSPGCTESIPTQSSPSRSVELKEEMAVGGTRVKETKDRPCGGGGPSHGFSGRESDFFFDVVSK